MQTNQHPKQTAADAYTLQREVVEQLIEQLQARLAFHQNDQRADPMNWGYAGDLEHIASCLNEALGNE